MNVQAISDRLRSALEDRYRIERELGAGGMATVYLAHDVRHDRKVAIKVLKPELAAVLGADRFVVEIKTTAAMSHPHILPLFDSGTADGFLFYVMPFIEGETIREKLNRETQFGVDEAVRIAREVAAALDYAHRNGVIHRDIKPENILLHDGRAMVMDFGIALAVSAAAGGRMTETGLSLGTPHYMSPEQATADKQITARSDIYSLASVLYEMLSGEPPHHGGSAQQVIMKILTEPAQPVTALRKSVPPNVAAALGTALEKLPADRFDSAKAFADALQNPSFRNGTTEARTVAPVAARVLGRSLSWQAVSGLFAATSIALFVWALSRSGESANDEPVVRAELDILTRTDSGVDVNGLDISPDGSMIVYAARLSGPNQLYLRRLDERVARPISGTDGATWPTFSPDGASIAYAHEFNSIRRIGVAGGVPENIAQGNERSLITWLRWGTDGFLYYANGRTNYFRVSARGGTPEIFLRSDDPGSLELLPGGRHVLYVECCGDNAEVRAADIKTGETRSIGVRASSVRYVPTGHLLLVTLDAVRVVPFDARRLTVQGEPRMLLDSVTTNGTVGLIATSTNGTATYFVAPERPRPGLHPVLVDLEGNERRVSLPAAEYRQFKFSPDGRRIAYASSPIDNPNGWRVSVHDLVVGTTIPLTHDSSDFTGYLVWRRDGRELLYVIDDRHDSVTYILSSRADGSGAPDTLWRGRLGQAVNEFLSPLSLTPDEGRMLLQRERNGKWDLLSATLDSTLGAPTDYLVADWQEQYGALSPDGRWTAYESNEEASAPRQSTRQVYVRSFPVAGERHVISDSNGARPLWAPDGRTIYYWRGQTLVAASVVTTPTFRVTGRRDLFPRVGNRNSWDISPDGRQIVMSTPPPEAAGEAARAREPVRLVVVTNWFSEIRRKLGEKR